jgi:hypothetical protein
MSGAEVAAREATAELRALSDRAEGGDDDAHAELRRRVRACSPEKVAEFAAFARRADGMLISTIAAGEPVMQKALRVRVEQMPAEVAGENPTPLEAMLASRVVSGWLLVEILEALVSLQYRPRGQGEEISRATPEYVLKVSKILESAARRHTRTITTLTRVRKLRANVPGVQFNTQINVGR